MIIITRIKCIWMSIIAASYMRNVGLDRNMFLCMKYGAMIIVERIASDTGETVNNPEQHNGH
jgi:hypothetical protein